MRRRDFMALLGGLATSTSRVARAQSSSLPVIGFLASGSPEMFTNQLTKFHLGLSETGFVEGQNVRVEYRWAQGQFDRLPALAADLAGLQVAAIAATGGSAPAQAAKAATTKIPIVFTSGDDPVELGFVSAINHPGGNMTGVSLFTGSLAPKRLQLLHELAPDARTVAFLVDPKNPTAQLQQTLAQAAAKTLGLQMQVLAAGREVEFETAFANLVQQRAGAILVGDSPFFLGGRNKLIALCAQHAIPAIFQWREYVVAGGLLSYGTSLGAAYRQMGVYIGRVLHGEKPADLPVMQPSVFELVVNLKTAKALGITIPPPLLTEADEVIE
jgi:putative tryptophan/tyrosine transport system substrate-binding protein